MMNFEVRGFQRRLDYFAFLQTDNDSTCTNPNDDDRGADDFEGRMGGIKSGGHQNRLQKIGTNSKGKSSKSTDVKILDSVKSKADLGSLWQRFQTDPYVEIVKRKSTEQRSRTKITSRGCICLVCVCVFRSH
eukprot:Gregarina_sp_Poly_1__7167@NODE_392_length_8959_cov_63_078835_g321_i0_p10_GENE_NODE_392_length_8959_cov_63_078835_g321_i0NODE_392_length_8959_cov_63_078835_g321_i0_p10_ORF_typecomplete_len132_score5_76_NODE_392_length_8959_cov_63_078835_g321_i0536931